MLKASQYQPHLQVPPVHHLLDIHRVHALSFRAMSRGKQAKRSNILKESVHGVRISYVLSLVRAL